MYSNQIFQLTNFLVKEKDKKKLIKTDIARLLKV